MVQMCMGNEPIRRSHKRPRLRTEIETEFELRYPPVRLNRRPRKTLDRETLKKNAPVILVWYQFEL